MGQVPYGSAYKNKGHIHHYPASLFHSHTHWAMTHYVLPQHASKQQVNASCTETNTKGFPCLQISPSGLFICKHHYPGNYWIDWYHWRHTKILTYPHNCITPRNKTLFYLYLAVVLRTKVWNSKYFCWSVLLCRPRYFRNRYNTAK